MGPQRYSSAGCGRVIDRAQAIDPAADRSPSGSGGVASGSAHGFAPVAVSDGEAVLLGEPSVAVEPSSPGVLGEPSVAVGRSPASP
jgi:hypothetical protein